MGGGLLGDVSGEENAPRPAVIPDLVELASRQTRIGDDNPGVKPTSGKQQARQRDAILADDHEAIATADSELSQRLRRCSDRTVELSIGQFLVVFDDGNGIWRRRDVRIENLVDTVRQAF